MSYASIKNEVSLWMKANRSQLNQPKTEVVWFHAFAVNTGHYVRSGSCRRHQGTTYFRHLRHVTLACILSGSDISMKKHINMTVRACFTAASTMAPHRRMSHIVGSDAHCVVGSSTPCFTDADTCSCQQSEDYCSSVLNGHSTWTSTRWVRDPTSIILNAAARTIFCTRMHEHITPLLYELHPLKVEERIKFKLLCHYPLLTSSWNAHDLPRRTTECS